MPRSERAAVVRGYGAGLDPLTHHGPCVRKSDLNAHDGVIIQCPIVQVDERSVYQKVIENTDADGNARDIRVPVFGSAIPFSSQRQAGTPAEAFPQPATGR